MKIISIFTTPAANAGNPSQDEMERMGAYITELREAGVLIDTGGRDNEMLEKIVSRRDGKTSATDGPFTEAKEVVGGYALMDVRDISGSNHRRSRNASSTSSAPGRVTCTKWGRRRSDRMTPETDLALDAIWRIEAPKLIAGLTRIVRDIGRAEELAQDAFVAALTQWRKASRAIPERG